MPYTEEGINELKLFFDNYQQFPRQVVLGPGEVITDVPKFLSSHFEVLKEGKGRHLNEVFYLRLEKLRKILEGPALNGSGHSQ